MKTSNVEFIHRKKEERVEVPDVALVYACGQGELEALGLLFERYNNDVYRFLSRLSGTRQQELDDLVQETFLQVQKSARTYKEKSSVKNWIFGISVNVVRHHVRSEVRRKRLIKVFQEQPTETSSSPFDEAQRRQQMEALSEAVRNLPYKQRTVFVVCDLEGVSGVEAARLLGLRQGTVWRRLHEARKALRSALGREDR